MCISHCSLKIVLSEKNVSERKLNRTKDEDKILDLYLRERIIELQSLNKFAERKQKTAILDEVIMKIGEEIVSVVSNPYYNNFRNGSAKGSAFIDIEDIKQEIRQELMIILAKIDVTACIEIMPVLITNGNNRMTDYMRHIHEIGRTKTDGKGEEYIYKSESVKFKENLLSIEAMQGKSKEMNEYDVIGRITSDSEECRDFYGEVGKSLEQISLEQTVAKIKATSNLTPAETCLFDIYMKSGGKLPTVKEMAASMGVLSETTVRDARRSMQAKLQSNPYTHDILYGMIR